jgi:anti-sigma regulatory factor (Ser/Thr protein kinase)
MSSVRGEESAMQLPAEAGAGAGRPCAAVRRWTIPRERGSLARARRLTREALTDWRLPEADYGHALLLVSELVTNAHRHAGGDAELELTPAADGILLAVEDSSTVPPVLHEPGPAGGFGLHLVARLSDAWGVDTAPGGKRVWARLAPRPFT